MLKISTNGYYLLNHSVILIAKYWTFKIYY
jgi:hypothetical protein